MKKAELINKIALRTGMDKTSTSGIVEAMMREVKECLIEGDGVVYMRGFGTFKLKRRSAKTARNIKKNTTIDVPARYVPYFKPAKEFAAKVTERPVKSPAKEETV